LPQKPEPQGACKQEQKANNGHNFAATTRRNLRGADVIMPAGRREGGGL
jgi:hypothetical protein